MRWLGWFIRDLHVGKLILRHRLDGECINRDRKGKDGGAGGDVLDEERLAGADEGGRLLIVLVVVAGAGDDWHPGDLS